MSLPEGNTFKLDGNLYRYEIQRVNGQLSPPVRPGVDEYHLSLRVTEANSGLSQILFVHFRGRDLNRHELIREAVKTALQYYSFGAIPQVFERAPDKVGQRY